MTKSQPTTCPCDGGLGYAQCCGVYHLNLAVSPPTAEALMRSRYSAYVLGLDEYLLNTWHPTTRPPQLSTDDPDLVWLGLRVKHHHQTDDGHAIVEFVARHKRHGKATRLHEISRFVFENNCWFYIDGDVHI